MSSHLFSGSRLHSENQLSLSRLLPRWNSWSFLIHVHSLDICQKFNTPFSSFKWPCQPLSAPRLQERVKDNGALRQHEYRASSPSEVPEHGRAACSPTVIKKRASCKPGKSMRDKARVSRKGLPFQRPKEWSDDKAMGEPERSSWEWL